MTTAYGGVGKRAEELARAFVEPGMGTPSIAEITHMLEKYGQEVREAAAIRGRITQMEGGLVDNAVREMPLP